MFGQTYHSNSSNFSVFLAVYSRSLKKHFSSNIVSRSNVMLYNIVRVLTTLLNMNYTHTRISIYRLGIGKRSNTQKFPMFDYKHVFLMKRQGKFFYEIYSIALFILCLNYIENILGTLWLKVPKCEIFHLFDFNDFYDIKSV
jgi:hypothetical protein